MNKTKAQLLAELTATVKNNSSESTTKTTGLALLTFFQDIFDSIPVTVKVSLTSAQILALNTTPIILLPKLGAGIVQIPISQIARYNFGTVPYTGFAGVTIKSASQTLLPTVNIDALVSGLYNIPFQVGGGIQQYDFKDNEDIVASALTANIGGDGTVDLYLTYLPVTL